MMEETVTEVVEVPSQKLEKRVILHQYGLLPPLNWGEDCFEHLFLMNKFWNRLVEIEQETRRQYRAILGEIPVVAALEEELSRAEAEAADLDARRKEARIRHRAKIGPHTREYDEAIKELRSRQRELRQQAREARRAAREVVQPRLDSLERERREMVKEAYRTSGLWWANYNAVVDSYNRARVRAMKEGAELKFHRFSGEGRFSCQIQGGKSTAELLDNVGTREVALRLIDQEEFTSLTGRGRTTGGGARPAGSRRDRRQYGILAVTVYTGRDQEGRIVRRTLDFPIILHRPLPEEGKLKMVTVHRRRTGTRFHWSAAFTYTCESKPVPASESPLACGMNLGWKQVKDGLRVATIFDGRGPARHIILPNALLARFAHVDVLKSRLDQATNETFDWLFAALPPDVPETLQEHVATLRAKHPHPGKLARFCWSWKKLEPAFAPDLLAETDRRRKAIKRLEEEFNHLREKVRRRRLDFYRNQAKSLAETYGTIALDRMDLRQLSALESPDGAPNETAEIARKHRGWAAVGELREWIEKQAAKSGAMVVEKAIPSTNTCSACGAKASKPAEGTTMTCTNCGSSYDRDDNAAANLLRAVQ